VRWLWQKRAGPLFWLGSVSKSDSGLAYKGLIFLYVLVAFIASCITYGITGFALGGV
jgi:hypothetical protein